MKDERRNARDWYLFSVEFSIPSINWKKIQEFILHKETFMHIYIYIFIYIYIYL